MAAFELNTYETTVGRYRRFLAGYDEWRRGGGLDTAVRSAKYWQPEWTKFLPDSADTFKRALQCEEGSTWTDVPAGQETKPINCVTWFEAEAFCLWDGARLPTEIEWEFAAAGGSEERLFPWGKALPTDCTLATWSSPLCSGLDPVGTHPTGVSKWGQQDMAGNVWEWTGPGTSNGAESPELQWVMKGGGYSEGSGYLRGAARVAGSPKMRSAGTGFRCAASR